MGFNDWLKVARVTDDPAGDLIGDMKGDRTFPAVVRGRAPLARYLSSQGACAEAKEALSVVWARYRRWRSKRG
jgi:hypothetical protein